MGNSFNAFGKAPKKGDMDKDKKDDLTEEKDRAMLQLKNTRDKLKRYRKTMEGESKRLDDQARALLKREQKDRALLILKLKKFKEKQASNCEAHLFNILTMIDNLDWASVNQEVFSAIKIGKEQLEKMNEQISIEDVESLLAENTEATEVQEQISSLLSGQSSLEDDDTLMADLAAMMEESNKSSATSVTVDNMPAVPTHIPDSSATLPNPPRTGEIVTNIRKEKDQNAAIAT
jgi:hypothetical protein